MQKAMNFNDIAIDSIKESDYRIRFWYMSKDDTINIMNNFNQKKKRKKKNGRAVIFLYYL